MLVVRTPLRISFAGGGSDLPAFCNEEPGFVVSAAIQKYVYIFIARKQSGIRLSYSVTENVQSYKDLDHDIAREALSMFPAFWYGGIEIVSMADLPSGAGLGSSGAFAVGILNALHALGGVYRSPQDLFHEASNVEIVKCNKPVGYQDQATSALGGLRSYKFFGEAVESHDLSFGQHIFDLFNRLLLVDTGLNGLSLPILSRQFNALRSSTDKRSFTRMMVEHAIIFRDYFLSGKIDDCAEIIDDCWKIKKSLDPGMTNETIDDLHIFAKEHGALAGKLCGAGGRGMMLFVTRPGMVRSLAADIYEHLDMHSFLPKLDRDGSRVVYSS